MILVRRRNEYHVEIHDDEMPLEAFVDECDPYVEIDIRNATLFVYNRIVVASVPEADQVLALSKILMDAKFFIDMETEYFE